MLLVAGAIFFYVYSYPKISDPDSQNPVYVQTDGKQMIYFRAGKKIMSVNSSNLLDRIGDGNKLQIAIGDTQELSFANQTIFAVTDTESGLEIKEFDLKTALAQTLVSAKTAGFENMDNFSSPKVSPDGTNLLFTASHNGTDYLYLQNLRTNSFTNLTQAVFPGKIISSSWSPDGKQIVFSGKTNTSYILETLSLTGKTDPTVLRQSDFTIDQTEWAKNGIYYLEETKTEEKMAANLYFYDLSTHIAKVISVLSYPSTVADYSISADGQSVAFSANNQETGENDLILSQSNGANLLQITEDHLSFSPVFSPDSMQLVFWRKGDGLFTINTDSTGLKKVYNDSGQIDKILAWR